MKISMIWLNLNAKMLISCFFMIFQTPPVMSLHDKPSESICWEESELISRMYTCCAAVLLSIGVLFHHFHFSLLYIALSRRWADAARHSYVLLGKHAYNS